LLVPRFIAFSSEVEPGSREENASKLKLPGSASIRTDKALMREYQISQRWARV
jgi:hypothetical protein